MTNHPELYDYCDRWQLARPEPLAQTATSHVYTVQHNNTTTAVLKILTEIGHEERVGAVALGYYDGHGAVQLLNHDDGAQLLEYVPGSDLVGFALRGDDTYATKIIARVLRKLHSNPPSTPPDGLVHLQRWWRELFRKADIDREQGNRSIYVRAAAIAQHLLDTERDKVVLHGDIHHENIRFHPQRGWLAIDPKGLYGERTYDTANTLCNPRFEVLSEIFTPQRLLTNATILSDSLDINLQRLLQFMFVYTCLSASWSLNGGGDVRPALFLARMVELHLE